MLSRLYAKSVLYVRFLAWGFRRRFMCPRGRHGDNWQYFGKRSRVCRCCHKEEWLEGGTRQWKPEAHKFAESRPSWTHTQPSLKWPSNDSVDPTNGVDETVSKRA